MMTDDKHNANIRKELEKMLLRISVGIGDIKVPLLSPETNQIIINCNQGKVSDLKPIFRLK